MYLQLLEKRENRNSVSPAADLQRHEDDDDDIDDDDYGDEDDVAAEDEDEDDDESSHDAEDDGDVPASKVENRIVSNTAYLKGNRSKHYKYSDYLRTTHSQTV